jgi:hypothetical protein
MQAGDGWQFPQRYGVDQLVLLVRDPWWLFAYWEVTPEQESRVSERLSRDGRQADRKVLRVYDVTERGQRPFFDIEVHPLADNWYIDVGAPDREWEAEYGIRARGGEFYALVRSNRVRTPRYGISDVIDEEWMMPDDLYWKLLGRSGGLIDAKSSLEVRRYLDRYLKQNLSSEAPATRAPGAALPNA